MNLQKEFEQTKKIKNHKKITIIETYHFEI